MKADQKEGTHTIENSEQNENSINPAEKTVLESNNLSEPVHERAKLPSKLGKQQEYEQHQKKKIFQKMIEESKRSTTKQHENSNEKLKNISDTDSASSENTKQTIVIGICGGIRSGKSELARELRRCFKRQYLIDHPLPILHSYYFYKNYAETENYQHIDFDNFETMRWGEFIQAIKMLKYDQKVELSYRDQETKELKSVTIRPNKFIIIEGPLIFAHNELIKYCDWKIFLDTDEDTRLSRLIYKQVSLQKQKLDNTINNYLQFSKLTHLKYVFPSLKHADIIVPNYGKGFTIQSQNECLEEAGFLELDHIIIELIMEKFKTKNNRKFSNNSPIIIARTPPQNHSNPVFAAELEQKFEL